ncbi:MAG: hypothetical protein FWD53_10515 [Phycisphaerales bacterium]|nr:hypothetical protein [Phycisphaerales bacterium]
MPITLEARRSFVRQCTCLSVWFARRLSQLGVPIRQAITNHTNVYRFTDLWDGKNHPAELSPDEWCDEKWEALLDAFEHIHAKHDPGNASAEMEAEALELFWPRMEPALPRDVAAWPTLERMPFGFFNYNLSDENGTDGKIVLHLTNPFAPASPFDDMPRRARELAALLRDAMKKMPGKHTVYLQSWLAGFPPLQTLFPPAFALSASPPTPLRYHLGWWGQLIDRTGDIHQRHAQHIRRTGWFRYPNIQCCCPLDDTFAHLHTHFGIPLENSR